MKYPTLVRLFPLLLSCALFIACSETKEDENEFSDWQQKNEAYFSNVYETARTAISQGSQEWKIIPRWSLDALGVSSITDNIVVKVLSTKNSTSPSPLYSDTTHVSYSGRLIPSDSYSGGYLFEKTYSGEFDPDVCVPVKLGVSATTVTSSSGTTSSSYNIDGMITTLMNMHVGDRWLVYIPWTMGYGTTTQSNIPGYSILIFDIYLHDYWHAGYLEK